MQKLIHLPAEFSVRKGIKSGTIVRDGYGKYGILFTQSKLPSELDFNTNKLIQAKIEIITNDQDDDGFFTIIGGYFLHKLKSNVRTTNIFGIARYSHKGFEFREGGSKVIGDFWKLTKKKKKAKGIDERKYGGSGWTFILKEVQSNGEPYPPPKKTIRGIWEKSEPEKRYFNFDIQSLRIAQKLSFLKGIRIEEVTVPYEISVASREIGAAAKLSKMVVKGDVNAENRFVSKLMVEEPIQDNPYQTSSYLSPQAMTWYSMAKDGPIFEDLCIDRIRPDLEILSAAFQIDAKRNYRDARLTKRAGSFIRKRRQKLSLYEQNIPTINTSIGNMPQFLQSDPTATISYRETGIDGEFPLFPPENIIYPTPDPFGITPTINPPLPDPPGETPLGNDICFDLNELCIDLFNSFATAALASSESQLIGTVTPDCLCVGEYNQNTIFKAFPDTNLTFPPQRPAPMRLWMSGIGDITGRIQNWSTTEISFTLPEGASSGYVYLRLLTNTQVNELSEVLSNLCGIPYTGIPQGNLSHSPKAFLSIIHPPQIHSFTINDSNCKRQ